MINPYDVRERLHLEITEAVDILRPRIEFRKSHPQSRGKRMPAKYELRVELARICTLIEADLYVIGWGDEFAPSPADIDGHAMRGHLFSLADLRYEVESS